MWHCVSRRFRTSLPLRDIGYKLIKFYYFQDVSRVVSYVHICHEHTEMRDMFLVKEHMLRKLSSTMILMLSDP
jgi:hypothetical protein